MKNITKILLILFTILLTLLCVTACNGDSPDASEINETNGINDTNDSNGANSSDENLEESMPFKTLEVKADFFEVEWNSVEGAAEYIVKIDGKEYRTKDTCYSLMTHIHPGETKAVRVTAVVEGVPSAKSEWGQVEYTAESVTEGLVYTKLPDGSYSVYCPSNAIPQNGELVLPDKYEGKNVTSFRSEKEGFLFFNNKSTSDFNGPAYTGISKVRLPAYLSYISIGALYKASISEIYIPDSVTSIGASAFEGCESLREVRLPISLETIFNFVFSDCTSLKSIVIPDSVKSVGAGAFARSGLTEITLPIGVTGIGAYTFYGCTALSEIEYKSLNLSSIGTDAFHNTLWYNSQPEGIVYYRTFLYDYKGEMPANTVLDIPAHIKHFAGTAMFKDETNLIAVTFPEGFRSIPTETFSGCTNLTQVTLSEGITSIGNGAFYGCPIETITLPESLTGLGSISPTGSSAGPFENCTKLTSVTIPGGVTTMSNRCFYSCTNLARVTIEEGVEKIGRESFVSCTALKELVLPESITQFYLSSIAYTGVKSLVWPKNIGKEFNYSLKSGEGIEVTSLVIQKETLYLDYFLLCNCEVLETFFFMGTEQEWEEIEIGLGTVYQYDQLSQSEKEEMAAQLDAWQNALTVYFYSEDPPTEEGNFWHYVDGKPVKW